MVRGDAQGRPARPGHAARAGRGPTVVEFLVRPGNLLAGRRLVGRAGHEPPRVAQIRLCPTGARGLACWLDGDKATFSPDGRSVATSGPDGGRVYDLPPWPPLPGVLGGAALAAALLAAGRRGFLATRLEPRHRISTISTSGEITDSGPVRHRGRTTDRRADGPTWGLERWRSTPESPGAPARAVNPDSAPRPAAGACRRPRSGRPGPAGAAR